MQVSDEDLDQLSSSCCEDYRRLPPYLGVEAIVLSDIIIERELKSETDRRLAFFRKWKKIKGSGANYQALISALLKINCREDADKICVLVKSLPQSVQSKGDPDALKVASASDECDGKAVSVSPETLESLEFLLTEYRKKIVKRYASYVHCIRTAILEKGISVSELCSYLLSLDAFQSGSNVQYKLLSGVKDKLEAANTIYQILDTITKDCSSFLDYEIYQCIVDQYDIDHGQKALNYPEYLQEYIEKHRIAELAKVIPKLSPSNTQDTKEVILKLDIELTSKLTKIIDLKKEVARILNLMPFTIRLYSIEQGCVVVIFRLPSVVAENIFTTEKTFSCLEKEKFRSLSVLWLRCDTFVLHIGRVQSSETSKVDASTNSTKVPVPDQATKETAMFRKLKQKLQLKTNLPLKTNPVLPDHTPKSLAEVPSNYVLIGDEKLECRYQDLEYKSELGRGSYGNVTKMVYKPTGHVFAVKQVCMNFSTKKIQRFNSLISSFSTKGCCPFLVTYHGMFLSQVSVYVIMELMQHSFEDLHKIVYNQLKIRIPDPILGKVAEYVLKALHYLNEDLKILHKNMKLSKVLINSVGDIKLTDFGIRGDLDNSYSNSNSYSYSNSHGGEYVCYTAPEMILGTNIYTQKAVVWNLGIILVHNSL